MNGKRASESGGNRTGKSTVKLCNNNKMEAQEPWSFSPVPSLVIELLHSLTQMHWLSHLKFFHLQNATTLPGIGFSFHLFQTFWLGNEFVLAFCILPNIWLTAVNNPDPGVLARPWRVLNRQLKCCFCQCPKLSQLESRQKPRIAASLLNFPDSPDVIAVLTCTDKVGPQQGECGHFPFKVDLGKRWSHACLLGAVQGGDRHTDFTRPPHLPSQS